MTKVTLSESEKLEIRRECLNKAFDIFKLWQCKMDLPFIPAPDNDVITALAERFYMYIVFAHVNGGE